MKINSDKDVNTGRVLRGGSRENANRRCGVSYRIFDSVFCQFIDVGFRIVIEVSHASQS